MPARDIYHDAVKNALVKDGWTITAENFQIRFKELKLYGDLEAKKIFAQKGVEKIVVEVKSFIGVSAITEFQKALGQYRIYKRILGQTKPDVKVYLAIADAVFNRFFAGEGIRFIIEQEEVSFFTVDLESEEIVQWKS